MGLFLDKTILTKKCSLRRSRSGNPSPILQSDQFKICYGTAIVTNCLVSYSIIEFLLFYISYAKQKLINLFQFRSRKFSLITKHENRDYQITFILKTEKGF